MDDIRVLKYFPLLLLLVIASVATVFSPILTAAVAVVILTAILLWRSALMRKGEASGSGIFIMAGLCVLLPPLAYITAGLARG